MPTTFPPEAAADATLLAACLDAPTVSRAWCLPAGQAKSDVGAAAPPRSDCQDDPSDASTAAFAATAALGQAASPALPDTATLVVEWGQRNLAANRQRRFLTHTTLARVGAAPLDPAAAPPPVELRDAVLTSPSPSGARQLIARTTLKEGGGGGGGGAVLEVWGRGRCLVELVVPPSVHGPVYAPDGYLSTGAAWSADEGRVAYVAEAPPEEETPEWGRESSAARPAAPHGQAAAAAGGAAPKAWKGVARAEADWGEALGGKRTAAVFVLDVPTGQVVRVPPPPPPPHAHAPTGGGDPDAAAHSAGQPALSPCGTACVYTAWPHRAPNFPALTQRLGLVYCLNRPCALWLAALPSFAGAEKEEERGRVGASGGAGGEAPPPPPPPPTCLTPALLSSLSPRFSPDGASLVFLSHEAAAVSGVHNATAALLRLPWDAAAAAPGGPLEVVVPVVGAPPAPPAPAPPLPPPAAGPPTALAGPFPGLYCTALPDRPFLDGGARLALTSQWGASTEVLVVDLASGAVAPAGDRAAFPGAWAFLAAGGGWAVATVSHPARPPEVVVIDMSGGLGGGPASSPPTPRPAWRRLVTGGGGGVCDGGGRGDPAAPPAAPPPRLLRPPAASALAGATWRALRCPAPRLPPPPPGCPRPPVPPRAGPAPPIEAIVISPAATAAATPPPGLLIPHGGPHAAHADAWAAPLAFLVGLGYACVLVNFRGSTGYGEAGVQSLPGAIGEADVADCMALLQAACAGGWVDASRVAVVGGSHGGFLAACLAGAHPAAFRAAVLRNPVTDLALMAGVTDIADWTFIVSVWLKKRANNRWEGGGRGGIFAGTPAEPRHQPRHQLRHRPRHQPHRPRNWTRQLSFGLAFPPSPCPPPHPPHPTPPLSFHCSQEALGSVAGRARARPDPTPADLAAFRAVSPIALVGRVTAPMLFLLGAGDRRVPPADAQRYVAALRARPDAPPCRVLLFPEDGHPLDKPQTEFESYMNIAAWLRAHL